MSNGYRCDSCNCSMSEPAYIENLAICSECFDRFLKDKTELVRLEKLGVSHGWRQKAWDLMNEDKDEQ